MVTTAREQWRKSKRSGGGGDCVEIHHTLAAIRDSKNALGSTLQIANLCDFVNAVKTGEFDL